MRVKNYIPGLIMIIAGLSKNIVINRVYFMGYVAKRTAPLCCPRSKNDPIKSTPLTMAMTFSEPFSKPPVPAAVSVLFHAVAASFYIAII